MINNAGVLGFPTDGELLLMTDYKQCMAVNFFGTVEVTKTFLPLLRKSKGRLVNVSSMGGESAFSHMVMGCPSQDMAHGILCGRTKMQGMQRHGWVRISQIVYTLLILTQ